jgi:tRNA-modifying protein YgfZ
MNQQWIDLLLKSGAQENAFHFGDQDAEIAAAATATVVAPLVDQGLIGVAGEDAGTFLHNLLTNDIKGIPSDGIQRAGLCTPKGRLLADLLIWRNEAGFLLQLSADILPGILKKLSMYKLRAKVTLSDVSDDLAIIGVAGGGAAALFDSASPLVPMRTAPFCSGSLACLAEHRFALIVPIANAAEAWQQLSAKTRAVGLAAWHWLDIAAGIPHVTVPTQEQFIPQMVNFELIGGVGFKKGCYPGQEIVARTEYLGKIKKRMFRARLANGAARAGDSLYAPETGDQACGSVVAVAPSPHGGSEVLAVIPSTVAVTGELHLGAPDGPRLTLLDLPYQVD